MARADGYTPLQRELEGYRLMGVEFDRWRDTHPPLDSLYLSLLIRASGGVSELPLHLGFTIFPVIAGVSALYLARRFTRNALAAALTLMAAPAFMVLSHTLMADLPLAALWLAATALYVYGVDRDDTRLLAAAGAVAALAILTGYQALALFVLLPAYPLLRGRFRREQALVLLIPLGVLGLYVLAGLVQFGELPRLSHAAGTSFRSEHILDRLEGMLLHTGGVTIFPLAIIALFSLRRRRYLALPLTVIVAVAIGLWRREEAGLTAASTVVYIVLFTAAATLLLNLVSETIIQLKRAVRRRAVDTDFLFLALWLQVIMAAVVLLLPHVTAKYTLVFLAPLVLLAVRELEAVIPSPRLAGAVLGVTLALTLALGTLLSVADYRLAADYRDFARSVAERYPDAGTVWFVGEWGFRHYMEAEGYRYLTSADDSPAAGDLIISPGVADWPLAPPVARSAAARDTHETHWRLPLRLMSPGAEAGFYGTHWGLLPYSLADVPLERYEVKVVGRDGTGPSSD